VTTVPGAPTDKLPVYEGEAALRRLNALNGLATERDATITARVRTIIEQVRAEGETALRRLAAQFGDPTPESFRLSPAEIDAAMASVPSETRRVLERAATNIRAFAEAAMQTIRPFTLENADCRTGIDWRPIERVACYVPGGRFPLPSTALMTAITAQTAGVPEIAIFSPDVRPETVYAGHLAGVRHFYRLGGAQAVAAAAFGGAAGLPPVDMVVGPGNAYVTEAKRQLQGIIGIDMLAGPSEVAIIADAGAPPAWVAVDLLAQAEHDAHARAYLLTDSPTLAAQTAQEIDTLLERHPDLSSHLRQAADWGAAFVLPSLDACVEAANALAPEHLELLVADPHALKPGLKHYGALFMGYHTSVPVGDYLAGPNHTLPTARAARFSGTLNPLVFLRPQSWMEKSPDAHDFTRDVSRFARLEGLIAHALSAESRLS
jgi:histidinol dehydrogenase